MSDERLAELTEYFKHYDFLNSAVEDLFTALIAERERVTALEKKCIDLCGALFSAGIHAAEVEMELDKLRAEIERLLEKK